MDPNIIALVAERKILEAIEEGKFENLPGKGKPIVFDDDPMTPPHLRMANQILRNANVLPEWMQVQKDLERERQEVGKFREKVIVENRKRRLLLERPLAKEAEREAFGIWHARSRAEFQKRMKSVNTLILKLSLMAPSTVAPIPSYKVEAEMQAFDADFPPLSGQDVKAVAEDRESQLKALARERYQDGAGGGSVRSWINAKKFAERNVLLAEGESEDIHRSDAPG
jgi:DnaJ homolog subfamily C member 28